MEFDELLITTGVDALVRLVKRKGKVELEECARLLNIPASTIEEWCRVLEEEGIIEIEYKLTKIYIVWVQPTEAEAAAEKESFYKEKKTVQKEVEEIKQRLEPDISGVLKLESDFSEFYKKAYPRLEALEKAAGPTVAAKSLSEEGIQKQVQRMDSLASQLDDFRSSLSAIKAEVGDVGKKLGAGKSAAGLERIEQLKKELDELEEEGARLVQKIDAQHKSMPKDVEMPDMREMRDKFQELAKELKEVKSRNARLREDMLNIQETQDIVKQVGSSLDEYETRVDKLRKEMTSAVKDADDLEKRSQKIVEGVRENADAVTRFADSLDVAKGILTRYPSQKKFSDELKKLKEQEDAISEKNETLRKVLEAVGGRAVTVTEFEELRARMSRKIESMKKESDQLTASLDEEKSTYLTFQKIKEKVVPSIEAYRKQLDTLDSELKKAREEMAAQKKALGDELKKSKELVKEKDVAEIARIAQEVKNRKQSLDEIMASLNALKGASENLNKRVMLLSREASLLELRGSGGGPPGQPPDEGGGAGEVKEKLRLTRDEEVEFRRKREELKGLIKKLWEET